jgi:hypothetical protein
MFPCRGGGKPALLIKTNAESSSITTGTAYSPKSRCFIIYRPLFGDLPPAQGPTEVADD